MKRAIKIIIAVVVVLALLVSWPVAAHYRAKWRVEAYRSQLRAKGEKLEISELVPPPSAEAFRNSAELMRAAGLLRSYSPNYSNLPPAMKFVAPGKALVSWQQIILPNDQTTNVWPALSAELAENRDALVETRKAAQCPTLAFDLDYNQGFSLLLPHLSRLKGIAQWLSANAIQDLHENRVNEAWTNLVALSALTEHYQDEPLLISELVRIVIGTIAANTTWETLQSSESSDRLGEIQTIWERMDFLTQTESVMAMERAETEKIFAQMRASKDIAEQVRGGIRLSSSSADAQEASDENRSGLAQIHGAVNELTDRLLGYWGWKYWQSYDDELANAQLVEACLESVRQGRRDRMFGPALKKLEQEGARISQGQAGDGRWLGFLPGDERAFVLRVASIEIQRALLVTAIALKRYQLKHGDYPATLESLKPEFLPDVPLDPMDGKPLRYRRNPDGSLLLYSVGEDGVDNAGDATPSPKYAKQWNRARDAVWPQQATPEEVKADFEKLTRKR